MTPLAAGISEHPSNDPRSPRDLENFRSTASWLGHNYFGSDSSCVSTAVKRTHEGLGSTWVSSDSVWKSLFQFKSATFKDKVSHWDVKTKNTSLIPAKSLLLVFRRLLKKSPHINKLLRRQMVFTFAVSSLSVLVSCAGRVPRAHCTRHYLSSEVTLIRPESWSWSLHHEVFKRYA